MHGLKRPRAGTAPRGCKKELDKGITFKIVSKEEAALFLEAHCNYFKMASYRKLYPKSSASDGVEKYERLDFGYLVDLYKIDRALQRALLSMTLDVELAARVKLLRQIDTREEDGYDIVEDYFESLPNALRKRRKDSLAQRKNDPYCGEVVSKYWETMPVWVFLEAITFGDLNSFYLFCASRWNDLQMKKEHYYLKRAKSVRNASAHGLCMLNGFFPKGSTAPRTPPEVVNALASYGLGARMRKRNLSIERLQQIAVLCYAYRTMTKDGSRFDGTIDAIDSFKKKMTLHRSYYDTNTNIQSSFGFLEKILTFAVATS